jgi:hypothetical protein
VCTGVLYTSNGCNGLYDVGVRCVLLYTSNGCNGLYDVGVRCVHRCALHTCLLYHTPTHPLPFGVRVWRFGARSFDSGLPVLSQL